jgi:hypothetical protein
MYEMAKNVHKFSTPTPSQIWKFSNDRLATLRVMVGLAHETTFQNSPASKACRVDQCQSATETPVSATFFILF